MDSDAINEKEPKNFKLQLNEILEISDEVVDHHTAVQQLYDGLKNSFQDLRGTFTVEQNQISDEKEVSTTIELLGHEILNVKVNQEKMAEQLNQLMTWNRPPTYLEHIKDLFYDNIFAFLFMILIVAVLGYLGLNWLIG